MEGVRPPPTPLFTLSGYPSAFKLLSNSQAQISHHLYQHLRRYKLTIFSVLGHVLSIKYSKIDSYPLSPRLYAGIPDHNQD